MGSKISKSEALKGPDMNNWPNFDPLYGFPEGRKERVMIATQAELESGKIELKERGYCAHLLLKYRACTRDVIPMYYRCNHQKHEYLECLYDDWLIRMKEYEREKRLMARAKRKAAKARREELRD